MNENSFVHNKELEEDIEVVDVEEIAQKEEVPMETTVVPPSIRFYLNRLWRS